jgi:hypothetical protein
MSCLACVVSEQDACRAVGQEDSHRVTVDLGEEFAGRRSDDVLQCATRSKHTSLLSSPPSRARKCSSGCFVFMRLRNCVSTSVSTRFISPLRIGVLRPLGCLPSPAGRA